MIRKFLLFEKVAMKEGRSGFEGGAHSSTVGLKKRGLGCKVPLGGAINLAMSLES